MGKIGIFLVILRTVGRFLLSGKVIRIQVLPLLHLLLPICVMLSPI